MFRPVTSNVSTLSDCVANGHQTLHFVCAAPSEIGVRPAVLPDELKPLLNELRSFRHVFRHSYEFQLDPLKLNALVAAWGRHGAAVTAALTRFAVWLRVDEPTDVQD